MTKTNPQDRDRLDAAVKAAIGRLERDADVVKALGHMPAGKPDVRYLDNSQQRLRKAGEIDLNGSGGNWRLTGTPS